MSGARRSGVVLGVVVLAAAAVAALVVQATAAKRWAATLERHQTAVARLRAEGAATREPISVRARPGNAWDEYEPAFASLATLSEAEAARWDGVAGMAVRRVREGVRRQQALYPFDPAAPKEPEYAGALRAAVLLARLGRERRAAGDLESALDALADELQMAVDIGRIPRYAAFVAAVGPLADPALDELRELAVSPRSSPAALARLRQLAIAADRQLPSSARAYAGEHAAFVEGSRRFLSSPAASGPGRWTLLRHGFSWRLHFASIADTWARHVENAGWTESQAWPALMAMVSASGGDHDVAAGSGVPVAVPSWPAAERRVRETRARLRLVQAAAIERLGRGPGGPEWPIDPFTLAAVRRREGEGSRVYWSVGTDGDQGGVGAWRPAGGASQAQDLVLEVRR